MLNFRINSLKQSGPGVVDTKASRNSPSILLSAQKNYETVKAIECIGFTLKVLMIPGGKSLFSIHSSSSSSLLDANTIVIAGRTQ